MQGYKKRFVFLSRYMERVVVSYPAKLVSASVDGVKSEKAKIFGFIYMIAMMYKRFNKDKILDFEGWLSQAINHQQIMIVFDSALSPVGFVTWAHLDEDTERRYILDEDFYIHPLEWNEGDNTWVMDFYCPKDGLRQMVRLLRERLRTDGVDKIFWQRRKGKNTKVYQKKL